MKHNPNWKPSWPNGTGVEARSILTEVSRPVVPNEPVRWATPIMPCAPEPAAHPSPPKSIPPELVLTNPAIANVVEPTGVPLANGWWAEAATRVFGPYVTVRVDAQISVNISADAPMFAGGHWFVLTLAPSFANGERVGRALQAMFEALELKR